MTLTAKVLWAMLLGIIVGLIINVSGWNVEGSFTHDYVVGGLFYIIGKMFITALKMLVVPLVFFSLISGVLGIGDITKLGKVGLKSFGLYILTTAIAIATAIGLAIIVAPGSGTNGSTTTTAMMNMVNIIMSVAPIAVFALLAKAISELGLDLLVSLAGYVLVLIAALLLHLFGTLMFILKLFSGLSPKMFLRKIRDAQVFAFSTASSNATIPVTLRSVTKRMGVDNSVASFTVPLSTWMVLPLCRESLQFS
jgi:Na+/H+-dicarboxylate symporter